MSATSLVVTASYSDFSIKKTEPIHAHIDDVAEKDVETVVSYGKSPYADAEIVSLIVGPDATPFTIHNTVLGQSAVLAAKLDPGSMAKQNVLLPELDEATAHTLVHYMYTGSYQYLQNSPTTATSSLSNYQAGTCVYCAAARYQLSGLTDLAKNNIVIYDKDVSISDILAIAKDYAFPLLPDNETWYPTYLEAAIKHAMEVDPEPFRRPDFITQVEGNTRLLQVVWKTVINTYASPVATSKTHDEDDRPPSQPTSTNSLPNFKDNTVPLHTPASLDGSQTTAVAPSPTTYPDLLERSADGLKLDDIEPSIYTPQALDAFTDELGFETSKMYKKMGKNEVNNGLQREQDSEAEGAVHRRVDSVVQAEEGGVIGKEKEKGVDVGTGLSVEGSEEVEKAETEETQKGDGIAGLEGANDTGDEGLSSKKGRKKGKKEKRKKASIVF